VGDVPVIAPILNTLSAQEFGRDYGDYYRFDQAALGVRQRFGSRHTLTLAASVEHAHAMEVTHTPAFGSYRPNPPLGGDEYRVLRLGVERAPLSTVTSARDLDGQFLLELGDGSTSSYLRASGALQFRQRIGATELQLRASGGAGSADLPAYRGFVTGGRSTLVGEPFRAYGGRQMALAQLEWRFDVPAPAIPLGSFASTGHSMTVAPFLAAGWAGGTQVGMPWTASAGVRPVAGLALEVFMRLVRIEAGMALRTGDVGVTVDINRDWWGAL
jgi:hypothetical protein